jgi:hypothetical protein
MEIVVKFRRLRFSLTFDSAHYELANRNLKLIVRNQIMPIALSIRNKYAYNHDVIVDEKRGYQINPHTVNENLYEVAWEQLC